MSETAPVIGEQRRRDLAELQAELRATRPRSGWTAGDYDLARAHTRSVGDISLWVDEHEDGTADYRLTDMQTGRRLAERAGLASVTSAKRAATRRAKARREGRS